MNDYPNDLVTTREAMKLLGLRNTTSITKWITSGKIRGWRIGARGRYRVSRADVIAMIQATNPPSKPVPQPPRIPASAIDAELRAKGWK